MTLDDALEEVVGDIRDAAAVNGKQYKRIARGCYRVEGSIATAAEFFEVDEFEIHLTFAIFTALHAAYHDVA